jgi:phenylalanyl-tRNA synthetase beta chain
MSVRGFAVESIEAGPDGPVIDFEVTANRPDCMSIVGMAREVAAACALPLGTGRDVSAPAGVAGTVLSPGRDPALEVVLEETRLCPRYAGVVADVAVGLSPDWMQARLQAAGIRPISNVVDITNYVLIELGHPMHAFDHARLAGHQVRVRLARPGERLTTLDGQNRQLSADTLVIADAERATAVAGVMGGAASEVAAGTTTIVLESAWFDPHSVRRTSRALGLKTEASMRFERGADIDMPAQAMARACALLESTGAGRARGILVDAYPVRREPALLHLRRDRIRRLLGIDIPDGDAQRILTSLGFALAQAPDGWQVTIPTRRVDVLREVDLVEELARHYGLDRLPMTFPPLIAAPPPVDPRVARARHLRAVLNAGGFSEAVTFGFIPEAAAARFAGDGDLVPIANPLSETFAVLRPTALPGLLDAVAHNRRREQRDVRLFEIGARFTRRNGEGRALSLVWSGAAAPEHWSGGARTVDFFDIKGIATRVCDALRVEVRAEAHGERWLVPGRSAVLLSGTARIALLGQLTPSIAEQHGLPGGEPVYVAEVDLDAAELARRGLDVTVEPLPRFPSVNRDISVLVDDTLEAAAVRRVIREAAPETLTRVGEFDRYQGKGVPDGKVSLSLRLTFRSSDRTLTDAEVQMAMDAVVAALRTRLGAVQR